MSIKSSTATIKRFRGQPPQPLVDCCCPRRTGGNRNFGPSTTGIDVNIRSLLHFGRRLSRPFQGCHVYPREEGVTLLSFPQPLNRKENCFERGCWTGRVPNLYHGDSHPVFGKEFMDYALALRLSFLTRGWLIGCSARLTLITANKNYQIPDSTKRIRAQQRQSTWPSVFMQDLIATYCQCNETLIRTGPILVIFNPASYCQDDWSRHTSLLSPELRTVPFRLLPDRTSPARELKWISFPSRNRT